MVEVHWGLTFRTDNRLEQLSIFATKLISDKIKTTNKNKNKDCTLLVVGATCQSGTRACECCMGSGLSG